MAAKKKAEAKKAADPQEPEAPKAPAVPVEAKEPEAKKLKVISGKVSIREDGVVLVDTKDGDEVGLVAMPSLTRSIRRAGASVFEQWKKEQGLK